MIQKVFKELKGKSPQSQPVGFRLNKGVLSGLGRVSCPRTFPVPGLFVNVLFTPVRMPRP